LHLATFLRILNADEKNFKVLGSGGSCRAYLTYVVNTDMPLDKLKPRAEWLLEEALA
jgi:hypothetical protein